MKTVAARPRELSEIAPLRELYREEMSCQIIHDSIHRRPGWTREFALELEETVVGYGSVAVAGPWTETPALYEFYVQPAHRMRCFDLFASLLPVCGAKIIETQSNAPMLAVMLHTFARNIRAEAVVFEDSFRTSYQPPVAAFRAAIPEDGPALREQALDDGAGWVVTQDGAVAGAGGVLYHYNPPYGDVYMAVGESFRNKGLGAYLVQELKNVCRESGKTPAARCNIANLASRRTLQKAGFTPCGNIIAGDLPEQP